MCFDHVQIPLFSSNSGPIHAISIPSPISYTILLLLLFFLPEST